MSEDGWLPGSNLFSGKGHELESELNKLEAELAIRSAILQTFYRNVQSRNLTADDLASFATHLEEWKTFFSTFEDRARRLRNLGLPQRNERLAAAGQDPGVQEIFQQIAEECRKHQEIRDKMAKDLREYLQEVDVAVTSKNKNTIEEMKQKWREVWEYHTVICPICFRNSEIDPFCLAKVRHAGPCTCKKGHSGYWV